MATEAKTATVYPILLYDDADAAMDWLQRLGFERREVNRDDEGAVTHAELSFNDAIVMLGTGGAGREPFRSLPTGGCLTYVAVDEIDSFYARSREVGAEFALELVETDYGSRDFSLRDLEGNLWAFGTYRPTAD